jgi:hypothetical protein
MKIINKIMKIHCRSLYTLLVILLFGLTSCDSIVEVTDPDIVTPESLDSEAGIATLRAGSLGDFAIAMSGSSAGHGGTTGLIVMSGLMTDEYYYSGTFPTRREADTRLVQNTNRDVDVIYGNLHRARASAEATISMISELGGDPNLESEMQSIVGFSYTLFAETFCSGVPFSRAPADGGELEFGVPLTTQEMFETAISRFDNAIATGNERYSNLGKVGKARALLGIGNLTEAANEVSSVSTDFVYNIEHSINSRRQENGIYTMTTVRRQFSIADGKGGNGLLFRSEMDPRTPWDGGDDLGQDDVTIYYNQLKYPSPGEPVVLASGIEARLIEAEALVAENANEAVEEIHNNLRARIGLTPVDLSEMSETQLREFHFKERAFWLFSTGHRLGDMRRLVRLYNREVSEVFPWGAYFKGGEYGPNVTFPIPQSEANNPNYQGCLDRNP